MILEHTMCVRVIVHESSPHEDKCQFVCSLLEAWRRLKHFHHVTRLGPSTVPWGRLITALPPQQSTNGAARSLQHGRSSAFLRRRSLSLAAGRRSLEGFHTAPAAGLHLFLGVTSIASESDLLDDAVKKFVDVVRK